jgi:hypothetical protein
MTRLAPLLLLLAASCRQQLLVDTREAELIPRDVALDGLKDLLATADAAERTRPRERLLQHEIREWVIDDAGIEARAEGREPIRVDFKAVTATRLDKVAMYYQVRVYTPAQPDPKKDYARFNWTSEAPARRALELFDALCRKP